MQVEFDDQMNDLAWEMDTFLRENGATYDGRVFNKMKPFLRNAIQKWVDAHKKELIQSFYDEALENVKKQIEEKNV